MLGDDRRWRLQSHVLRPIFVGRDRPFSVTIDPNNSKRRAGSKYLAPQRKEHIQVSFTVASGVRDIIFRHPEAPGVGDIVKSHSTSHTCENLKGIGQQMEIHRITVTPTQA